jgi:hypothetical protein
LDTFLRVFQTFYSEKCINAQILNLNRNCENYGKEKICHIICAIYADCFLLENTLNMINNMLSNHSNFFPNSEHLTSDPR